MSYFFVVSYVETHGGLMFWEMEAAFDLFVDARIFFEAKRRQPGCTRFEFYCSFGDLRVGAGAALVALGA